MISQDFTLASDNSGRFSWLAGASYYKESGFYNIRSFGGLLVPGNPPLQSGTVVNDIDIKALAAFAELTYKLTDQLTIIAGGRISNDKPSFSGLRLVPVTGVENPASAVSAKDSFSSFTPRVSLRYAITPTTNAYATYSRGFKSGVFNGNSLQVVAVKPETVDSFEVGLKGSPSRLLSFDMASYYYKYKNLQFASFGATSTNPTLRNAAQAEIYGFEANTTLSPVENLTLRAGLSYTHGKYTDFQGAQGFRPTTNCCGRADRR